MESKEPDDSLDRRGFLASLVYSSSEAFTIKFDGTGNVVSVTDAPTMADLPQMKD